MVSKVVNESNRTGTLTPLQLTSFSDNLEQVDHELRRIYRVKA